MIKELDPDPFSLSSLFLPSFFSHQCLSVTVEPGTSHDVTHGLVTVVEIPAGLSV